MVNCYTFRSIIFVLIVATVMVATSNLCAQTVRIESPTFTSIYDLRLKSPVQVLWPLSSSTLGVCLRSPNWKFKNDLPKKLSKVRSSDFDKSGFDKGHLCPAQDFSISTKLMRSTFVLSNCSPQTPALNRGQWLQTENRCRQLAMIHDSVEILVVPVFLNRDTVRIGKHNVPVPHAFFKAIWVANTDSVVGCWFYFNR